MNEKVGQASACLPLTFASWRRKSKEDRLHRLRKNAQNFMRKALRDEFWLLQHVRQRSLASRFHWLGPLFLFLPRAFARSVLL
jgi:hypothetical protein